MLGTSALPLPQTLSYCRRTTSPLYLIFPIRYVLLSMYSVATNFLLGLIEPSDVEVECQKFFWGLTLFHVSLGLRYFSSSLLTHPLPIFPLDRSPKNKHLASRRLYKLQAKIIGHAVDPLLVDLGVVESVYAGSRLATAQSFRSVLSSEFFQSEF